jgi:hypothetical protein
MKVYELKQMISAFDNYYHPLNIEFDDMNTDYISMAKYCNELMLNDKAEGNY